MSPLVFVAAFLLCVTVAAVVGDQDERNHKAGELCRIGVIEGQWTDIGNCIGARKYIQVAEKLERFIDDHDILVCCETHEIRSECLPNFEQFEFTRVEHERDGSPPRVTVTKSCDDFGGQQRHGEQCGLNGIQGVWTLDQASCGKLATTGCCRLETISEQKCREYSSFAGNNTCDLHERQHFVAEIFTIYKSLIEDYIGILISERYLIANDSFSYMSRRDTPFFVHFHATNQFLAIETEIKHVHIEITLLQLTEPVAFSRFVRPVCLLSAENFVNLFSFQRANRTLMSQNSFIFAHTNCLGVLRLKGDRYQCLKNLKELPMVTLEMASTFQTVDSMCVTTVYFPIYRKAGRLNVLPIINEYGVHQWVESVIWDVR